MQEKKLKAVLFDLDGVVFDTEPQYTIFWGMICRQYHPEHPGLEHEIKGSTLTQIYDRWFMNMLDFSLILVISEDFLEQSGLNQRLETLLLLSRFSRVQLCNPIDSSPLGSPVHGILQARTLEWVAMSFSNA